MENYLNISNNVYEQLCFSAIKNKNKNSNEKILWNESSKIYLYCRVSPCYEFTVSFNMSWSLFRWTTFHTQLIKRNKRATKTLHTYIHLFYFMSSMCESYVLHFERVRVDESQVSAKRTHICQTSCIVSVEHVRYIDGAKERLLLE